MVFWPRPSGWGIQVLSLATRSLDPTSGPGGMSNTRSLTMTGTFDLQTRSCRNELALRRAADGRLLAIIDGEQVAVRLRQCFPWSEPSRHLSLRNTKDVEVALVDDPTALSDESRDALERALAE